MQQLNELLEKWSISQPEKVYLHFRDDKITYKKLFEGVNNAGFYLKSLGINPGDRVGLFLKNSPEFLYAWFALNKIGAIMVPINTGFKKEETSYILTNSACKGVIAEQDAIEEIIIPAAKEASSIEWIAVRGELKKEGIIPFEKFLAGKHFIETIRWPDDDLAAILYTSGTTGKPKGVMCPHRYYSRIGNACAQSYELSTESSLLTLLPLFHMNAQTLSAMGSLVVGGSLILLDKFDPYTFWNDICKYKATVFNYLGAMLPVLSKLPVSREENELHGANLLAVGAQADPNLMETYEKRWGVKMLELYGLTEIGGTANTINDRKIGSIGFALPGHTVRIVDENGKQLPPNEVGEITITGPSITLGYWRDPVETNKTYKDNWLYTEDLGYQDEDGFIYFVGRKKDIIRKNGENISAVEVENVIMNHPKVVEAAAISVPDDIRDEEVKVYIVLTQGETVETLPPEQIIAWCEQKLAKFKIPRYIEYRNSLPKTETQKIQKNILKQEKDDLTTGVWD
ncbi:MAG: AMP-binding protein, partial [Bacillota bacterium]|nr:AMP-binding protein [Bacillota bacterium]